MLGAATVTAAAADDHDPPTAPGQQGREAEPGGGRARCGSRHPDYRALLMDLFLWANLDTAHRMMLPRMYALPPGLGLVGGASAAVGSKEGGERMGGTLGGTPLVRSLLMDGHVLVGHNLDTVHRMMAADVEGGIGLVGGAGSAVGGKGGVKRCMLGGGDLVGTRTTAPCFCTRL